MHVNLILLHYITCVHAASTVFLCFITRIFILQGMGQPWHNHLITQLLLVNISALNVFYIAFVAVEINLLVILW